MYSKCKMQVFLKTYTRADSKKWRADSIVACWKSFNEIMNWANSKESEPTRLECRSEDSSLELTHLKKSQLKYSDYLDDSELESTPMKKSRLDQSQKLLNWFIQADPNGKIRLDQSIISKDYTSGMTRGDLSRLKGRRLSNNG